MKRQEFTLSEIPLPNTEIIERQVISDAVGNPESMGDMIMIVTPDMFTSETRKYLWDTLVYMFNRGEQIDLPTFSARTGNYFINEIVIHKTESSTPYTSLEHAKGLRTAAVKRRAYFAAIDMLQSSVDPDSTEVSMYDTAQNLADKIQGDTKIITEQPISNVVKAVENEIIETRKLKEEGRLARIPTGFPTLDRLTYQGWKSGQLIVLAARPSVGKTAVMLQFAKTAAMYGFPSTIFSLEMGSDELCQRLLYSTGEVNPFAISTGSLSQADFQRGASKIQDLPIYINDESKLLDSILARLTIAVYQGRCKIAFIDYLGLVVTDESGRTPIYQSVSKITRELKLAAKKLKIPIVLVAQINRESAKEGRPPEMYDLRDSGSIEQDADIVLMMDADKKEAIDQDNNVRQIRNINLWVRKNRQFLKDVLIKIQPNDSYSHFVEINSPDSANFIPPPGDLPTNDQEDEPF